MVERETSAATHVVVPTELLASPVYANLRKAYARLRDIVGPPPFDLAVGKKTRHAETYEELRALTLELAKESITLSRFKGLGEMDAEELADTTMDPAKRMLVRVDVEDAAAADRPVLDADGRPGRTAAPLHRGERKGRPLPGCLARPAWSP